MKHMVINDQLTYRLFHDIDFNLFPYSILRRLKTKLYPISSLFLIKTPNAMFYLDDMVKVTNTDEYSIEGLKQNDIVLDIGACIGGFALRVYNKCKFVYTVEPIMTERLQRNIKLNKAENIKIFKGALGYPFSTTRIDWAGYSKIALTYTLTELIKICGGHIDFLKLDVEGAEWTIDPDELKGIRRIEIEVHKTKEHACNEFLEILTSSGYRCTANYLDYDNLIIIHAFKK